MTTIINASTTSGLVQTADTSGTLELQSNGTTKLTISSTGAYGQLVSGTAVASTSGTSIDFTSLPSWVKRITVMFNQVSTNGSSNILVQIGAGSVTSSGYVGGAWSANTTNTGATTGFLVVGINASTRINNGVMTISSMGSNTWAESVVTFDTLGNNGGNGAGVVSLSGTLDRVRITTVNGTDAFDAGSVNILYEG
jgi:hypothetical protein